MGIHQKHVEFAQARLCAGLTHVSPMQWTKDFSEQARRHVQNGLLLSSQRQGNGGPSGPSVGRIDAIKDRHVS